MNYAKRSSFSFLKVPGIFYVSKLYKAILPWPGLAHVQTRYHIQYLFFRHTNKRIGYMIFVIILYTGPSILSIKYAIIITVGVYYVRYTIPVTITVHFFAVNEPIIITVRVK